MLILFSVGSIHGSVLDKFENVVPFAELDFVCSSGLGDTAPNITNRFGSFVYDYAPSGVCTIHTRYEDAVGFGEMIVESGQINQIKITLDTSIIDYPKEEDSSIFGIGVVILIGLALVIILLRKPKRKKRSASRKDDIMKTLNHKEINVVKYLTEKYKFVSQNELAREVGIPKTSLIRVIDSLKDKNIIEIESIGKFKKIKLTKWFLD